MGNEIFYWDGPSTPRGPYFYWNFTFCWQLSACIYRKTSGNYIIEPFSNTGCRNLCSGWSWWLRPKELALNRKLRIDIVPWKEDNLARYSQIFEKNFQEISVSFNFHPGISGISLNGPLFRNVKISGFSGTFPMKFLYHLSPFQKLRNFWLNEKFPKIPYILSWILKRNELYRGARAVRRAAKRCLVIQLIA